MTEMKSEIDTALAQEKLDTVLDALYSATSVVVGLQATTIASVAESDAIRNVLITSGLCTEAGLLHQIADNIENRMEEMVDAGILDEEALEFQMQEEEDVLAEV